MTSPYVNIIIPTFNEESNLADTYGALVQALESLVPSFEITIVNDASLDKTGSIADDLARNDSRVSVLHHSNNRGIGRAFVTGVANGRGEWLMLIPADLAMDLSDLHKYFEAAQTADVIVGLASQKPDFTLVRRIISRVNIRAIQILFGMHEEQFQYICLYRVRIFRDIVIEFSDSAFFHAEILIKAKALGYRLVQVVIGYIPRRAGHATGANPLAVIRTMRDMLGFWMRWVLQGPRAASTRSNDEDFKRQE